MSQLLLKTCRTFFEGRHKTGPCLRQTWLYVIVSMRNLNKISSSTDIIGYAEKLYSFALRGFFLTSSMRHPCFIIRILFLTKTNKTLAVTQGPRPLFLIRLRLAPKQASASRSRRRNSLRSSGLHHSKKNLENRLTQKSKELRLKRDE